FEVWRDVPWPGEAAVVVTRVHIRKGNVNGRVIDGKTVDAIAPTLSASADVSLAKKLKHDIDYSAGVVLYGESFILSRAFASEFVTTSPGLAQWLRVYVNGKILNESPDCQSDVLVADFGDEDESKIANCTSYLEWLKPRVLAERSSQT